MGHIPTHPFPEASPDPNLALTQTLNLTQGRVGTCPGTKQGPVNLSQNIGQARPGLYAHCQPAPD